MRNWTNEVFTGKGAHVRPERSFALVAAQYAAAADITAKDIALSATLVSHLLEL